MLGLDKTTRRFGLGFALIFVAAAAAVLVAGSIDGSGSSTATGRTGAAPKRAAGPWRLLPELPFAVDAGLTSVWTGKEMIISGQTGAAADGSMVDAFDVVAAYNPATETWRGLAAPPKTSNYCRRSTVWTGNEMLVWGCSQLAFNLRTNTWRRLPAAPSRQGIVVWTDREMIGWGGGCCGDADAGGSAYSPATNTWRKLARSPLAADQQPLGAWTGRELIVFVGGVDAASGKPAPARLARAAAYNPLTDTWRRIEPMPLTRRGANAVWDGHELLVVGGTDALGELATVGLAYDPKTNQWRRLPRMESGRTQATAVWDGYRLLIWGGQTSGGAIPAHGLAYGPRANRWSALPQSPLSGRVSPTAVWTGHELIVWNGVIVTPAGTSVPPKHPADGAAFVPGEAGDRAMQFVAGRPVSPLPQCC